MTLQNATPEQIRQYRMTVHHLCENTKQYMLAEDMLLRRDAPASALRLMRAHNPYLDLRDREIVLENKPEEHLRQLRDRTERYAAFRQLVLHRCEICDPV